VVGARKAIHCMCGRGEISIEWYSALGSIGSESGMMFISSSATQKLQQSISVDLTCNITSNGDNSDPGCHHILSIWMSRKSNPKASLSLAVHRTSKYEPFKCPDVNELATGSDTLPLFWLRIAISCAHMHMQENISVRTQHEYQSQNDRDVNPRHPLFKIYSAKIVLSFYYYFVGLKLNNWWCEFY